MATKRLLIQGVASTRALMFSQVLPQRLMPQITEMGLMSPTTSRSFSRAPRVCASPVPPTPSPASRAAASTPNSATRDDSDHDSVRHAAFLGEGDSNDGHDAVQEAYGDPAPSLDASHSAYLGEADSDDGFEARKDVEGRDGPSVDASHSAFLGEGDSDDGFEGRRVVYPEEGDHKLEDTSASGIHGQAGEGDSYEEDDRRR